MNGAEKSGGQTPNLNKINAILSAIKENESKFSFHDINPRDIKYYPESFKMCEMNSCGCFNTNWACAPASPDMRELFSLIKRYKNAAVFTLKYKLADDYDWVSMQSALSNFNKLCQTIKDKLQKNGIYALLLGSGACDLCKKCTYPKNPCRFPDKLIYPLEAAGIDAYSLLKNGEATDASPGEREYIGLIVYN